jgi:hypothetical protein
MGLENYRDVTAYESSDGLGVKIMVAVPDDMRDRFASISLGNLSDAITDIVEACRTHLNLADALDVARGAEERQRLLECFPIGWRRLLVQRNGYCSKACCINRKWLLVMTPVGPIQIGWRKRVISIDFSQTVLEESAGELFPSEDVTKYDQVVHAWGYEKAKEYIERICCQ